MLLAFLIFELNFYQIDYIGLLMMVNPMRKEMLFLVYSREVYSTHDMWFGVENMLLSCPDDGTVIACMLSQNVRSESLNKDLRKISAWG